MSATTQAMSATTQHEQSLTVRDLVSRQAQTT